MLAIAGTAAARVIVVASSGPAARTYPMGRVLPDDAPIRLRQRESVTILSRAGTRIFRGPGAFRPSDPVRAGPRPGAGARGPHGARLGGIMMSSIERRPRIGAVAGAVIGANPGPAGGAMVGGVPSRPEIPPPPAPGRELPTIWDVDLSRGGTVCLRGAEPIRLTRPAPADGATLDILGPGDASRSVEWPAESQFLAWPADLPVADGAIVELRGAGAANPTRIAFRRLAVPAEAQLGDPVALAELFLAQGCRAQLDRLVEATLIEP